MTRNSFRPQNQGKLFFANILTATAASMGLDGKQVAGVKVLNINEESGAAIEKMVAKAIAEVRSKGMEIQEIQTTPDYLILVLIRAE